MFLAFGAGCVLYVTRRVTGILIWAMLIHGLWDFTGFIGRNNAGVATVGFTVLNAVIGVTFAIVLVRRERGVRVPQAGS